MKNKRKLLCMLIGFIFVFMLGCGSSKSNASKQSSQNNNNISQSQKQLKEDENSKKQDANSEKKESKESSSKNDDEVSKQNGSSKDSNSSKTKIDNKSNVNTSKNSTSNNKSSAKAKSNVNTSKNSTKSKTFTIVISEEEKGYTGKGSRRIATKKFPVENNKNAMIYLKENFAAKDKGGLIVEVSGIHNVYPLTNKTKEQKKLKILGIDWFIYLNGKKTPVGANDVYPKEGDVLQLDIHQWDKRELKN